MEAKAVNIALLTPYTGGNLGDAAIQEAAIANIRKRYPDASLSLVSIIPELTAGLHDVPSFPIGRFGQWQVDSTSPSSSEGASPDSSPGTPKRGFASRAKAAAKSSRFLYSIFKPVHDRLWPVYDELLHIRRAYRFLSAVDLVMVSGGGQLDEYWGGPWDHPYALFKWGLLSKLRGARFVVLSVGTCALESKLSVFFIGRALRLAGYRSYRDRRSKELLEDLEFTRGDEVYPDLAFSYSNEKMLDESRDERPAKVIGVSPICYLSPHGWPDQDPSVFEPYFEALVDFVRATAKRGYSIVLFSSDGPDEKIVGDIVEVLTQENDPDVVGKVTHPCTRTLPDLLEQLSRVDFVVASRLHGVLLSHRFRLPVLAISYDRKVDTYMEDVGLSKYRLDIHQVGTETLLEVFEAMVESADSIRSTLAEINDRYARDLQRQYDVVLEQFAERGTS
jgi:polysaccharide pyruvyl transferase WcaK-like protein